MKKFIYNSKAFTLAEAALVLAIMVLVLTFSLNGAKSKVNYYNNKFLYYSAFKSLTTAAEELYDKGCTAADVTNGICAAESSSMPIFGHTTVAANGADNRGLCDRIANEIFNISGAPDCTATANSGSDFLTATPSFITVNGMKFYNVGADAASGIFTVYVDFDTGSRRQSQYNVDVMAFTINTNSTVLPAGDSVAADSTEYLSASVSYKNASGADVFVVSNVGYKQAACTAGKATGATYCGSYTQHADCVANSCSVVVSEPGFFLLPKNS